LDCISAFRADDMKSLGTCIESLLSLTLRFTI